MRSVIAAVGTLALLIAAVVLGNRADDADTPSRRESSAPDQVHWVKLTFGLDDQPVSWDGQVTARDGRILESAPWSFEVRDRFDSANHKWFCTTVVLEGRSASSFAEPQRGVLVRVERSGKTQLGVETRQGNFAVDVTQLEAGTPKLFLDGRASAELLGDSIPLSDHAVDSNATTEDDEPTLAINSDGHRHLAWLAYEEATNRDHLRVIDLDDPQAKAFEIPTAREQMHPKLIAGRDGDLRLFWSAPRGDNWEIWESKKSADRWSDPLRLTTAEGSDFHLDAAAGADGSIWLVWQAFRGDHSDILAKRSLGGSWSQEIVVADSSANEWEPAVSVDPAGRAWIAYDSYENGNYDVFLTDVAFEDGQAKRGQKQTIAGSADFEAHASVDATQSGVVWVAYDAAGPNWGKNYTRDTTEFQGEYGETLHASRRIVLRAVVGGKLFEPKTPFPQELTKPRPEKILHSDTEEMKRFYELPQLMRDGYERLWVLFRMNRQGYAGHPKSGANWEFFATTYIDGAWLKPILIPLSKGRQNQQIASANGADGRVHLAWSTGDHHVDLSQSVRIGRLPPVKGTAEDPPLQPIQLKTVKSEPEPIVRSWKMQAGGENYQIYFGDLHRHTDISLCFPTADGCLVDAYRYALDASRLDFLAITDHTRDTDPLPWWRTQKTNDLFYVKGRFAPIYGYERSNGVAGGGHRNVFFLERDWPVYRSDAHYSYTKDDRPENNNPDVALYPHLRGKNALTAAHTPGWSTQAKRGTWTYHDPQVEPIAEIIQTFRRDYERPGQPQWRDARVRGALREEASLWYALARGHKLGFIASSDHHATHTSYACVWAKGPSREEIFEALQSRRTYAATDKILLEVRMGEAMMGQEIKAPVRPELQIRVKGTAPIEEVQIVRNRTVVKRFEPNQSETRLTWRDDDYNGQAAYYYVRVRQSDNNMAWGSPIWVK